MRVSSYIFCFGRFLMLQGAANSISIGFTP
uniref:Tle cognate immunity protein 4 N-terminal domain n=1 Tax=Siphoviridae sp. ctFH16 TaxID=2827817 RepID=A0A8S5TN67_9CAUD|nr:MAG TPA: Tle cognate immunity protein 4 N-terminal domain [Siphoviridae sp. ctFH16]